MLGDYADRAAVAPLHADVPARPRPPVSRDVRPSAIPTAEPATRATHGDGRPAGRRHDADDDRRRAGVSDRRSAFRRTSCGSTSTSPRRWARKGGLDYVTCSTSRARKWWIRSCRSTRSSGTTIARATRCSSIPAGRSAASRRSQRWADRSTAGKSYTLVVDARVARRQRPAAEEEYRKRTSRSAPPDERPLDHEAVDRSPRRPPAHARPLRRRVPGAARSRTAAARAWRAGAGRRRPRRRRQRRHGRDDVVVHAARPVEGRHASARRVRDAGGSCRQPHRPGVRGRSIRSRRSHAGSRAHRHPVHDPA